jgi:hypothetical protein
MEFFEFGGALALALLALLAGVQQRFWRAHRALLLCVMHARGQPLIDCPCVHVQNIQPTYTQQHIAHVGLCASPPPTITHRPEHHPSSDSDTLLITKQQAAAATKQQSKQQP